MDIKWVPGSNDGTWYLGKQYEPDYRGYVVRTQADENDVWEGEKWYVYYWDFVLEGHEWAYVADTLRDAQMALERITPKGHLCEVFISPVLGHCPERAVYVTDNGEGEAGERLQGILLCDPHSRHVMPKEKRVPVHLWEADYRSISPEDSAIVGERLSPAMASVRRGAYLSVPVVWGDDWTGYRLRIVDPGSVKVGSLAVFGKGNAFRVESIDKVPIPDDPTMMRFNCNGGATYLATGGRAVAILVQE
ncbi:hypothetical protein OG897_08410 [Streptomyces sp. NBC_00237]|uniref:hypothetical protein n=1 Tax=Streptomyces sp. NBC_00237 TaxID=2975687 RepID=UPI002250E355|nr:hypothetical protein [Streptomyces sp. NBC_00237]MCX5201473.1 hypothetical protein [Streptomyces sp. NBC_00237]